MLSPCCDIFSFSITLPPICSVCTPDSILNKKENYPNLICGGRQRYSTCTGAAWFHGNYLAIINLYARNLRTYTFNEKTEKLDSFQYITNKDGAQLDYSENLSVSPDGKLLAVCYNGSPPGVNIYSIDLNTHLIQPKPVYVIKTSALVHCVRFSPDGSYLAYVTFDKNESVVIAKLCNKNNSIHLDSVCKKTNNYALKAKSICFTKNSEFVVVAFCDGIGEKLNKSLENRLVSYTFDSQTGVIGAMITCVQQDFSTEDIAFLDDDRTIVATNQDRDELIVYSFNPETGQLGMDYALIKNPEAELSFPHSIGVSRDEKYMVITNHGNDTFNLYRISR